MDIERRVLDNGLKVFIERKPIRECAAYLVVNAGWVNDTVPEIGHVVEHLQNSGSKLYSKRGALNYVRCNAFTEFQTTKYVYECFFPEDLLRVLKNLREVLLRPHIRWLDRELIVVRKDLEESSSREGRLDERIFAIISPKHDKLIPSNRTSRLSLDKIDSAACCDFFDRFYSPGNSFLYVTGGLNSGLEEGIGCFERIREKGYAKPVTLPVERVLEKRLEFSRKGIEKPFVKIAHQLPPFSGLSLQRNIAKTFLFRYLAEDYGPMNRRLRDIHGLCYSFDIAVSYSGNAGEAILRVETEPDNFSLVEKEYFKALSQISLKGIGKDILETFRKGYQIQLIHKATHFDLNRIFHEILHNLQPSDIEQAVDHVDKEDVAYVARMLLDRGYVVAKGLS